MRLEDLKARVQPVLEQDVDALYDEFVEDTGRRGPREFLDHLTQYGLVPEALAAELGTAIAAAPPQPAEPVTSPGPAASPQPVAPPAPPVFGFADDDSDESATVVLRDDMLGESGVAAVVATPEPAPKTEVASPSTGAPAGLPSARSIPPLTSVIAPPASADPDAAPDDPDAPQPRRTMFRRLTDGEIKETGVQELEERRERRRKRSEAGETTSPRPRAPKAVVASSPADTSRYNFIGTVGEGAMGRIHLAEDNTLHRKVAYKSMSQEIAEQSTLASKFTAEAQITAQLDHPNIVPVYNLEGDAAYTMKLIQGRTLENVIHETRDLYKKGVRKLDDDHSLQSRLELFLRACDAMFYAHSRGVVHRDLKPENIMVGMFGELYVMDWGIARVMDGPFTDKVQLGAEPEEEGDLIIGTPGYMSPEQAEGRNEDLDGRSDQYALGLILFELVALKPAVTGKAPLKIVMRHQDGEKDPFTHASGDTIPQEIIAIVHKATAKNRDNRYENVRAMADDVRRYLRGEAVLARPDSPFQALLRWMGRHRELTLGVMFLIFMGSGTLVASIFVYSQFTIAAQRAREQQVSNLLTTVARQGSLIDGQFLKYEGLLSVIGTSAIDSLTEPPRGDGGYYLAADFGDPAKAPAGMVDSKRYGMPVSLDHGVFLLPEGMSADVVRTTLMQLADLRVHFRDVLLRSHSEDAAHYTPQRAERALAEVGVPVAWAYVGLENGVYTTYPGHGQFQEGFEPRESAWYALAKTTRAPIWGAPSPDQAGVGLVLTCAQSLYDGDRLLGVAGVDVTFDYIIEELLEAPEFKDAEHVEAFLLDPEGRIAVRSSKKGKEVTNTAIRNRTIRMPEFHHAEIVKRIKEKHPGGGLDLRGAEGMELVFYNRMNSIGWYYVVVGDVDEMLSLGG